jgi:hypothetical protein
MSWDKDWLNAHTDIPAIAPPESPMYVVQVLLQWYISIFNVIVDTSSSFFSLDVFLGFAQLHGCPHAWGSGGGWVMMGYTTPLCFYIYHHVEPHTIWWSLILARGLLRNRVSRRGNGWPGISILIPSGCPTTEWRSSVALVFSNIACTMHVLDF